MRNSQELLLVANFLICSGIFWACVCRLNAKVSKLYRRVRTRYTLLLAGAMVMGLQPILFGERPTVSSTVFAGVILAGLILNMNRWTLFNDSDRRHDA